jgi:hypothetical protein
MIKIKEIRIQADCGDYLWSDLGLISIEDVCLDDLSELDKKFKDWASEPELFYPHFKNFPWDSFHKRGITLSRSLKGKIDPTIYLYYRKTPDDPNYEIDEITDITEKIVKE